MELRRFKKCCIIMALNRKKDTIRHGKVMKSVDRWGSVGDRRTDGRVDGRTAGRTDGWAESPPDQRRLS